MEEHGRIVEQVNSLWNGNAYFAILRISGEGMELMFYCLCFAYAL